MDTLTAVPEPVGPPTPPPPSLRQEVALLESPDDSPAIIAMVHRGIRICRKGDPVARRLESAADARLGLNRIPLEELRLGKNVAWDPEKQVYIAARAGHATMRRNFLDVDDILELSEDIDIAHGLLQYEGQLTLHHNILDLARVVVAGNLTVHGTIEAADVRAGGDLVVVHGICGKEKGHVGARGHVKARFVTNARVSSGGDMHIANEVVNSHLSCGATLKVEHGTILAGHAAAVTGIHCHTAGSEMGAKTILEAGMAPECYAAIEKTVATAETSLQKAREIKAAVEPLLAHAKALTAAQKEKATELLYNADEAEQHAHAALAQLAQHRATLQACMSNKICIASMLYPGVVIRYPIAEAAVPTAMRGPLEITVVTSGGETHIVVLDKCRNTTTKLPNQAVDPARANIAQRILHDGASVRV